MKKLFLLLIVSSLFFTTNAFAQKSKQLNIGLGGAFTNTWIVHQNFYGEPEVDYAPKFSYGAIFSLGYDFTEQIALRIEAGYSAQGQKYDGKQNSQSVKRDIKLNYLNIPLFFKYSFGTGLTKFRFMAGPQLSILLSAEQDYTRDGQVTGKMMPDVNNINFQTDATDIKNRFESTDFGFALDIGADIYLSKEFYINAGLRGNYGFSDINAPDYRIENIDGVYEPSHNLFGGIYVGINYLIDVESYKQRNF
ncbi:MAG: PorT family protein [Bacteroidales bacterium]|nr:PorT family protein [Bacteroidales bacterium]